MVNHFDVGLLPSDGLRYSIDYNENQKLEAHELVLRPLIDSANEVLVYGLNKTSKLMSEHQDILIRDKGKYKLDLNKEVISGHESLWNSVEWERGSIVIMVEKGKFDYQRVLQRCYRPGVIGNPKSGNSGSAIKYCIANSQNGFFSFCLAASNGIDWMTIYGPQNELEILFKYADNNCKELDFWDKQQEHFNKYK